MDKLRLFIPICKVDEEKRLVYGRVTEEAPDSSGEVFDYETSKPFYKEWTDYFEKATDGKSFGNLRAMHDVKKAIGTLPEVSLNDKDRSVEVVAKVVDDDEWQKTLEGVYTGFSQGGRYVKRWYDGKNTRYTAAPNEISLVDYPALKSATFSLVKADGVVEDRPFKKLEKKQIISDLKKWAGEEISDVSSATYALQSIFYLYQKEVEENEPGQAADLKAVIDKLKNFIASEIKETTIEEGMAMLDKFAELKKAVSELTDEMIKSHSKETLGKIQGIHDHSSALGAKCSTTKVDESGDLAKLQGDLAKIQGEKDEALKKIETLNTEKTVLTTENDTLKKRVTDLEAQPAPAKGAVKDVITVTKQDDTKIQDDKVAKLADNATSEEKALFEMKKVHGSPIAYRLEKPLR